MSHCLLVDSDPDECASLQEYLQPHGLAVEALADGELLHHRLPAGDVDLLLLDLTRPDTNGLRLCQWVKQQWPALPVILFIAPGDALSRVLGLALGANDCFDKPFEPRELLARIKCPPRRSQVEVTAAASSPTLHFVGWTFDRLHHRLRAPDGSSVALLTSEYLLLSAFVDHPEQVLGRENLRDLMQTPASSSNDYCVDHAVMRLREKLLHGGGSPLIRTVHEEGYCFEVPVESLQ